jgi:8-oxo-dGTP pyrophosphatase MutT (NUDIX family)
VSAIVRPAARALVLDHDGRTLLVRYVNPDTGEHLWTTPGGGIGPSESLADAVRRELKEEAGLEAEIGPVIWTRREVYVWAGKTIDQREQFVLVRTPQFEPTPEIGRNGLLAEDVHELRWWTLAELEASDAVVYPTRLAQFLRELLAEGPPEQPIDVGV